VVACEAERSAPRASLCAGVTASLIEAVRIIARHLPRRAPAE